MNCLDTTFELRGNWNTSEAKLLVIDFEPCNPEERDTCKSEEEIRQWLRDKYIMVVYNTQIFNRAEYGEKRIHYES